MANVATPAFHSTENHSNDNYFISSAQNIDIDYIEQKMPNLQQPQPVVKPPLELSATSKQDNETILKELKRVFLLTRQYMRTGFNKNEILAKCPSCSKGKAIKTAYTATINTDTMEYSCSNCFDKGSIDKYTYLAKTKLSPKIESQKQDLIYFKNLEKLEVDQVGTANIIKKTIDMLHQNKKMLQSLTGNGKNQLGLTLDTLNKYHVGLVNMDSIDQDHIIIPESPIPTLPKSNNSSNLRQFKSNTTILVKANDYKSSDPVVINNQVTQKNNDKLSQMIHKPSNQSTTPYYSLPETILKMSIDEIIQNNSDMKNIQFAYTALKLYSKDHQHVKTINFDKFTQSPGLFGFHTIPLDSNQLIITSDGLDAMAAYQLTGVHAISLPTDFQLPAAYIGALERFEQIYIWLEDSYLGRDSAESIAKKLGIDKCLVIHNTELSPAKFMKPIQLCTNDTYISEDILNSAKPILHDKIMSFESLASSVKHELMNPDFVKGVQLKSLPEYNKILKGLRPGELTIFSGTTGVGKTTVISNLSLDYCKSRVSTLWGSFEIPNVRLASRLLTQFSGQQLTNNSDAIELYSQKFSELPMYFLKFRGSTSPLTVLETMRHAIYAYDVKHIIIDNLQFMMSMQHLAPDSNGNKFEAQDAAISSFRTFATEQNVHVTVVVHTRKEQPGIKLDLNSIFGSSKVTQEADNVIMLKKDSKGAGSVRYLEVLKNRFDGTLGKAYFKFDPKSYLIKPADPPKSTSKVDIVKMRSIPKHFPIDYPNMTPEQLRKAKVL
ncbi:hypothetical protein BB561_002767 [Smittium simulii]|uniref:SF4 helicase domain-containing protein n=1 Tax=Smittium simulii TaxID=133385 RepID=A0A2T9YP90_9FUNG|nr:hypothetical protein BB561_002767 [Smittium simulii]